MYNNEDGDWYDFKNMKFYPNQVGGKRPTGTGVQSGTTWFTKASEDYEVRAPCPACALACLFKVWFLQSVQPCSNRLTLPGGPAACLPNQRGAPALFAPLRSRARPC